MLSGDDIGFRVESIDLSGKAVGPAMVRYNGNWTEQFAGRQPSSDKVGLSRPVQSMPW